MKYRLFVAVVIALLAGCQRDTDNAASTHRFSEFREAFVPTRTIALEENSAAISVTPYLTFETTGELLIADPSEAQVRSYDSAGALRHSYGKRGSGPGELIAPVRAVQLDSDSDVLVLDMSRGVLRYTGDGHYQDIVHDSGFVRYYDMAQLADGRILITGQQSTRFGELALVEMPSKITTVYPSPFGKSSESQVILQGSDWLKASAGPTSVAIFRALVDTIFLSRFDRSGPPSMQAIRIPLTHPFKPLPLPTDLMKMGRRELADTLIRVHDVFWLNPNFLIVQLLKKHGQDFNMRLVGMSTSGEFKFEIQDAPRLLGVRDGNFLFVDPDATVPNRFIWMKPKCEKLGC